MQKLMRVEQARERVSRVWQELRRMHGLKDHQFDSPKIVAVIQSLPAFFSKEPFSSGKISRFEVGHKFVTEHLVAALKASEALALTEEKLLRQYLGRVYDRPPRREINKMAAAAKALGELGGRGQKIYEAINREVQYLLREFQKPASVSRESPSIYVLANPALRLDGNRSFKNFAELADYMQRVQKQQEAPTAPGQQYGYR